MVSGTSAACPAEGRYAVTLTLAGRDEPLLQQHVVAVSPGQTFRDVCLEAARSVPEAPEDFAVQAFLDTADQQVEVQALDTPVYDALQDTFPSVTHIHFQLSDTTSTPAAVTPSDAVATASSNESALGSSAPSPNTAASAPSGANPSASTTASPFASSDTAAAPSTITTTLTPSDAAPPLSDAAPSASTAASPFAPSDAAAAPNANAATPSDANDAASAASDAASTPSNDAPSTSRRPAAKEQRVRLVRQAKPWPRLVRLVSTVAKVVIAIEAWIFIKDGAMGMLGYGRQQGAGRLGPRDDDDMEGEDGVPAAEARRVLETVVGFMAGQSSLQELQQHDPKMVGDALKELGGSEAMNAIGVPEQERETFQSALKGLISQFERRAGATDQAVGSSAGRGAGVGSRVGSGGGRAELDSEQADIPGFGPGSGQAATAPATLQTDEQRPQVAGAGGMVGGSDRLMRGTRPGRRN